MDIQSFDRDFERRLEVARREVRLVRAIPAEVRPGVDGRPELIYQGPNEMRISESYDLVVLSIGISPDPAHESLATLLGVGANQDGFLGSDGEDVSTNAPGVFVAGAVQGPKSIDETVTHAIRTAGQVAEYLKQTGKGDNE
jgi:heterodisulfide reductase subunit A